MATTLWMVSSLQREHMESISSPTDVAFQGCLLNLSANETPENADGYGRTDNSCNIRRHGVH